MDPKETLCVLVLEEYAGDGIRVFVAQALEGDMATQVSPTDSLLDVVEALGIMFDTRDSIIEVEPDVAPLPAAPQAYHDAWLNNSVRIGKMPLGKNRNAEVRLLRDRYAIAIAGRKRPEVVKLQ